MRTFKKIIFSLIISLMIFTLVGCQSKSNNSSNYQSNDKSKLQLYLCMDMVEPITLKNIWSIKSVKSVTKDVVTCMFYLTEKFSLVAKFQRSLRIQL